MGTLNPGLAKWLATHKKGGKKGGAKLGLKNVANGVPAGGMSSSMVPNGVAAVAPMGKNMSAPKAVKKNSKKKSSNPFGFKAHGTMKRSKA